jgi:hypothetical protein
MVYQKIPKELQKKRGFPKGTKLGHRKHLTEKQISKRMKDLINKLLPEDEHEE